MAHGPSRTGSQDGCVTTPHTGPSLGRVPSLSSSSALAMLGVLLIFEQGACVFICHWALPLT